MRIYSREAFMALPAGTIFAKGKPWYFEDICVKGDTINLDGRALDWGYRNWAWVSATSSEEAVSRLTLMAEAGESYPIEDDGGRDGCFDDEDLFLVFERADLLQLKTDIEAALELTDKGL